MTSKLIDELQKSKQLISDVSIELSKLSEENKILKAIIYRIIARHGNTIEISSIDDDLFERITSADVYIDNDLKVRFSGMVI